MYIHPLEPRYAHHDDEVKCDRTAKASAAFCKPYPNVRNRGGVSLQAKLKVYSAVVIPRVLSFLRLWSLDRVPASCQKAKPLPHRLPEDRIPDTEGLARAGLPSIHTDSLRNGSLTMKVSPELACQASTPSP